MGELARQPESPAGGAGGSAFDDFLSRLRPYPAPPDFRIAQLYGVAGSALTLLAAGAATLLPSGEAVQGDGFHAVGATFLASVLDLFGTLALPLAGLGAAGLLAVAIVSALDRSTALAGGVLVALPMIGIISVASVGIGWLLLLTVTVLNLLFWIAAVGLIGAGLLFVLRGQLAAGLAVVVLGFAVLSALENAASDQFVGSSPSGASQSADPPPFPSPAEPRREQQERQQATEGRRRQQVKERRALGRERVKLEQRMEAEYAAWRQVPYVPPCDGSTRRTELDSLREELGEMARTLRTAQQNRQNATFHRVRSDLKRVAREREQAVADPYGFYERFGTCPSGAGAMEWLW
jgi:hypothetical protein